jgi:hypothetical protein
VINLVPQSKGLTAIADVHQPSEMTDATVGIALAHENAKTEGENGAGLEIAATGTDEMETKMGVGPRIERGAPAGIATRIDEVGEIFNL